MTENSDGPKATNQERIKQQQQSQKPMAIYNSSKKLMNDLSGEYVYDPELTLKRKDGNNSRASTRRLLANRTVEAGFKNSSLSPS